MMSNIIYIYLCLSFQLFGMIKSIIRDHIPYAVMEKDTLAVFGRADLHKPGMW